jgi:hypothetical protein
MAITHTETQLAFSATTPGTVTANSTLTSDIITLDDTCVAAQVQLKATLASPAADDYIDVYLQQTLGDPDGADVADEYDTDGHAVFLCRLDSSSGGENGTAIATVPLPLPQKSMQFLFRGDHSGTTTNSISVSGRVIEQRAA